MARLQKVTPEQEAAWREWVAERPPTVRAVAERFDPWTLYRMKSTGQRVTFYSIGEHENGEVTLTVNITGEFNAIMFDRQVFGVNPDDLEPCDPPAVGEPIGTLMTSEEVDENIDALRVMIRPDLFTMGDDGKAKRKS